MARDNRTIRSGVRLDSMVNINEGQLFPDGVTPLPVVLQSSSRLYEPDSEDELDKALSPEQGQRLLALGVIEGDWEFEGAESEPAGSTAASGANPPASASAMSLDEQAEIAASFLSGTVSIARSSEESATGFLQRVADANRGLEGVSDNRAAEPMLALKPLGIDIVGFLIEAGLDTPEKISAASDGELEALKGIGPATVAKIRELLKSSE